MNRLPDNAPRRFYSTDDIRRAHERTCGTWFSPENMRFFGTRVHYAVYGAKGRVFVTSEQPPHGTRKYSVRLATVLPWDESPYGYRVRIDTVGGFCAYASRSGAHAAARRIAAEFDKGGYPGDGGAE